MHFCSWKGVTSVLFGFMKWRHSGFLNIIWTRLDWNRVCTMQGILFFLRKPNNMFSLFCHFSPLLLCLVYVPIILFQQELDYGDGDEVWKTYYLVWYLTFSICSRGPIFTLLSRIHPCWLRSGGKRILGKEKKWDEGRCRNGNDIGVSTGVPPGSVGFLVIL